MTINQAQTSYKKMNITEPYNFSDGWLCYFKIGHGARELAYTGENNSADEIGATVYNGKYDKLVPEHQVTGEHIYNALIYFINILN